MQVGRTEIVALAREVREGAVYCCIRAEEVTLQKGAAASTSARNQLPARIVSLTQEGALIVVELDCGFSLTAVVTKPAAQELGLHEGELVTALVKAPAIHLVSRG